jgi:hypothetical protein
VCVKGRENKKNEEKKKKKNKKNIRKKKDAAAQPYPTPLYTRYSQGVNRKERRHSHTDALLHTSHN